MKNRIKAIMKANRVQVNGKVPYMKKGETLIEAFARTEKEFIDDLIQFIENEKEKAFESGMNQY